VVIRPVKCNTLHLVKFRWDPAKAAANKRKHGVSFAEAASCFEDEHCLYFPDSSHSERFVLLASSVRQRLLVTIHAELDGPRIRIISARKTTSHERAMKKAKSEHVEPSRASLRELPEIDFGAYGRARRNPFAKRIRTEGWELVHDGPSRAALDEMPETDFSRVRASSNPYAARIKTQGYELQVGRRRPAAGTEVGPTVVKSVRLPPALWRQLEEKARSEGVALHALVRTALEEKPRRKKRTA
jgi:uncharacterized DUF497 family protein